MNAEKQEVNQLNTLAVENILIKLKSIGVAAKNFLWLLNHISEGETKYVAKT